MADYAQTPSQTVGPFFSYGLLREDQHTLTNLKTKGVPIRLTGTVFDGDGVPVPDAMIEIWQADAAGIYQHPDDPRHAEADPNFKGFGRSGTENAGSFVFDTVKPGRPQMDSVLCPHICLRVFSRGILIHATTRVYFADEDNTHDPILDEVPESRRNTLIAKVLAANTYVFDIHLQGEQETVFFDI